ncbi:ThuA domain-containing protein [Aggregatilinea lenta]|uniref:ThuA domain-containing protein n=1 Tax=Aggregatilinea lenta TaxID=913108 RepID=UPI000E5C467F|nr:ThuA domain-containing protein [Aggregatilinea lenta]
MALKTAVITGGHHLDVPAFYRMCRALPGVDAYVQHLADFVASPPEVRQAYAVLVFYTHLKGELNPDELGLAPGRRDTVRSVLDSLGSRAQGIVVLHHSLLAFPGWDVWDAVVGMADRTLTDYTHGQPVPYHVADAEHPICAGLPDDWTMTDETYLMPDAAGDNHILLTTDHPRSMRTLAWTRLHRESRVFCLQGGDDPRAWDDPHYRTLLVQGIRWCGRKDSF